MTGGMCPVGCGRGVRPGNLLCYACWAQVPKSLQRELERAFQAVHGVRDTGSELRVEAALERYRKAYVAAIHAVQVANDAALERYRKAGRPRHLRRRHRGPFVDQRDADDLRDVDDIHSLLDAMASTWIRDRDARRTEGDSA